LAQMGNSNCVYVRPNRMPTGTYNTIVQPYSGSEPMQVARYRQIIAIAREKLKLFIIFIINSKKQIVILNKINNANVSTLK